MAARHKMWTPEKVRQRIRTSMLVHRLKKHALGQLEMTATQIKAAEILLRKALPDLQAIEHSGSIEQPLSRDAILERLALLHAAAAASPLNGGTAGNSEPDPSPETAH